ncbi:MAG: transcription termination factor NusA, partial [Bacilli bacterium]|nr:transcription termination factor NusA [Bacilli bacterium]
MAINVSEINAALEQIEINKGISRERVIESLKESMAKAYRKSLGGDDALVNVVFDLENGKIEMYQIKNVVADVEDDLLEISVEDAEEEDKSGKKYKVGDEFRIYANLDELRKAIVITVKNLMKQKFAEAEKEILQEQFKDKINTLITGRVEQYDDRGASINIGRTSVYLPRKEMIKDERFAIGDTIKLFVNNVENGNKGARIVVSRACEGFLKALMTEEIHDIYNGTIVIKSLAREAGERSKVAVYSSDINVDPAGACIGPNGSRIQKVVSQLGNGSSKEKIDIIAYKENPGLFIMEALKPAHVVGIKVDEEKKSALVVVKDDSLSLAIGRKGVNARLAVKLTGYNIDIKVESEALEEGLEYQSFEELSSLEMEEKARKIAEAQKEALVYQEKENIVLPGLPEGYVAPQARSYEEETNDFDTALEEVAESEETAAPEEVSTPEVEETPVQEEVEEVEEKKEEAKEQTSVKTTTTLEDLEKSLEEDANKQQKKNSYSRRKKKSSEEDEESEKTSVSHAEGPRMS